MKFFLLFFSFLLSPLLVLAQTINLDVSHIPDSLQVDANAVVRYDHRVFEVKNKGKATYQVRYACTILNNKAADLANLYLHYDLLKEIDDMEAQLHDAEGNIIKKFHEKDFKDQLAHSSGTFVDDTRVKYLEVMADNYPYTIVFEYSTTYNGLLFYPNWTPIDDENISLQEASFQAVIPTDLQLRYKNNLLDIEPVVTQDATDNIFSWKLQNQKPIKYEVVGPYKQTPSVLLAPSDFSIEKHDGNLETWEDLGTFYYNLNKDRDALPEATIQEIKALVANETDQRKIIEKVYKYVQERTRYVGIQLGIGGWQTFKAETVDKNKYGDCKALTNYTQALLKNVGIPAYYTLIRAGRNTYDIDPDFTHKSFNHVILTIPLDTDTMFLECTSQKDCPNYLGYFTDDRYALLVKEEGSHLIRTPAYSEEDNVYHQENYITLQADGNATAKSITTMSGGRQGYLRNIKHQVSSKEKEKSLNNFFNIASFTIDQYTITNKDDAPFQAQLDSELSIRKFASKAGKRFILSPALEEYKKEVPGVLEHRQHDIINHRAYTNIERSTIVLPPNFIVENIAKDPVEVDTPFGIFTTTTEVTEDQKIIFTRTLKMHKFSFPPDQYEAYRQFLKSINENANPKVMIAEKK